MPRILSLAFYRNTRLYISVHRPVFISSLLLQSAGDSIFDPSPIYLRSHNCSFFIAPENLSVYGISNVCRSRAIKAISAICLCDGISVLTTLISCGQKLRKSIIYKQNMVRLE
jgi:hypothetical protein